MGLGRTIFILAIIVAVIYFLSPTTFDKGVDGIQSFWKSDSTQTTLEQAKTRVIQTTTTVDDNIDDKVPTDEGDNSTTSEDIPISYEDDTTPQSNVCLWNNAGLPDYYGTIKEGRTCADSVVEPDWECIANPPTGYPGVINIIEKTSSPLIRCCLEDGLCRWNN